MKMIKTICSYVTSTDFLPVAGGSAGALTQAITRPFIPTWEAIIYTAILAIVGAAVGYLVKLLLDYIVKKCSKAKDF